MIFDDDDDHHHHHDDDDDEPCLFDLGITVYFYIYVSCF